MPKRFNRIRLAVVAIVIFAAVVYFKNASWIADPIAERPYLVAHRGLAQAYSREELTGKTCTATRMIPTGHDQLENTLPSIAAAFALGADAVELDVHRTTDDRFAVFHDWTLDCRTEGNGVTHEHALAELQQLDVGYGYTADGGTTFPFRGTGVGMMPSLQQVLDTVPDRALVIDMKTNNADDGRLLAELLVQALEIRSGEIMVYGGPWPKSWRPARWRRSRMASAVGRLFLWLRRPRG